MIPKEASNDNFPKNNKTLDGLSSWCRICHSASKKGKYVKKTPAAKDGHKICTSCKAELPETLEFFAKNSQNKNALHPACKKCANQKQREKYVNDIENERTRARKYKRENREKVNRYMRGYNKTKRQEDPFYRACMNIRARAKEIVKDPKLRSRTIGCTGQELKTHLEKQFKEGMTWENYGEWHIDHIYPLSVAFAQGPESFKKACHYTNLQPLWAADNIRKSNRVD